MGSYVFGTRIVAKKFCKICGVNITNAAAEMSDEDIAKLDENYKRMQQRVQTMSPLNLRVLDDVRLSDIKNAEEVTRGTGIGVPYVNP